MGDVISLPQYADIRARLVADLPIVPTTLGPTTLGLPTLGSVAPPIKRRSNPGVISRTEPGPAPQPVSSQNLDASGILIARFISPDGHFDQSHAQQVAQTQAVKGTDAKLSQIVTDPGLASVRAKIVAELGLH